MNFVDRHVLREARAQILERQGKYWEAIKQWSEDGKTPTALDVFLRHITHTSRDPRIMDAITNFLWRNLSFGRTWPKSAGVRVDKILPLLVAMSKLKLGVREKNMASVVPNRFLSKRLNLIAQIDTFRLVLQKQKSPTSEKDLVNILHRPDIDNALKLWALDHLSNNVLSILNDPTEPGILAAKLLQRYSALIKEVTSHKAPWKVPWICALFHIKEDGAHIQITPATFLHDALGTTKSSKSAGISGALLSHNEFGNILRRHLAGRLRAHIMVDRISSCPCVQFGSHENCHEGFPDTHQPYNSWFNQRVRFHLLRIMILDEFYSISQVDKFSSQISNQRYGPSLPLFRSSRLKLILMSPSLDGCYKRSRVP